MNFLLSMKKMLEIIFFIINQSRRCFCDLNKNNLLLKYLYIFSLFLSHTHTFSLLLSV